MVADIKTIIGYAKHIFKVLGLNHKESVYGKALRMCLQKNLIPHRSEICCPIFFMEEIIAYGRADFIVDDTIIEIKANKLSVASATDQIEKYIKSLNRVEQKNYSGLIINFNQRSGKVEVFTLNPLPVLRPRPSRVISKFFQNKKK